MLTETEKAVLTTLKLILDFYAIGDYNAIDSMNIRLIRESLNAWLIDGELDYEYIGQ